jgi:hypothetical protein
LLFITVKGIGGYHFFNLVPVLGIVGSIIHLKIVVVNLLTSVWKRINVWIKSGTRRSSPPFHGRLFSTDRVVSRRWQTLTVLSSLHYLCTDLCVSVDDDFIYEDEEEEEPDIDVENGYYNAKGTQAVFLINTTRS